VQAAEVIIYANQGAGVGIADLFGRLREGDRNQGRHRARGGRGVHAEDQTTMSRANVVTGFMPDGMEDLGKRGRRSKAVVRVRARRQRARREGRRAQVGHQHVGGFKRAMLEASSIMYAAPVPGPFNRGCSEARHLRHRSSPRSESPENRLVAGLCGQGQVEIGIQQTT